MSNSSSRSLLLSRTLGLWPTLAALSLSHASAVAADLTLKVVEKEPPREFDASLRQAVQVKAVQLLAGDKAAYEFWFNTSLALKSKPASVDQTLQTVKETTLLALVAVSSAQRDYKENEIAPGLYTARLGLQPQDGDHLGTADYPYFAVLVPAKADSKLDSFSEGKAMLKASGKDTSTGHPVVLSLRPVSSEEGDLPKLTAPAPDHQCLRVRLPARLGDDAKAAVTFDLVYKGKGKV
jgi:hypothetical protein